jgi:DNA repair protein RadD
VFNAHGVLSSGTGKDLGYKHTVIIGTFQTVMRRAKLLKIPTVIIIDECHLVPENSRYSELLERFPKAIVIGLTATPFRGRAHIVQCGLEWESIYSVPISHLIEQKYLVPPRSMATPSTPDMEISDGDERPQRDIVTKTIVKSLLTSVIKEDRRKCLVFCSDIEHAKFTVNQLRLSGEAQVYLVHSKLKKPVQDAQFAAFENSAQRCWLVNVAIVSIGVDIPAVDCIAILRDIRSFALLVQIIGRGLRLFAGKHDCLVYDFGSGTRRFGFVDDPQFGDEGSGHGGSLLKCCPECSGLMHAATMECVRCGWEFPRATKLNANAIATQLLAVDYSHATYMHAYIARVHPNLWRIEHRLMLNDEQVRAIEMRPGPTEPDFVTMEQGAPILIKRIDRDVVEMLGCQLNPGITATRRV